MLLYISIKFALVAQLDRAFGYEPKGRGFESRRARQRKASRMTCFFSIQSEGLVCNLTCGENVIAVGAWNHAKRVFLLE